MDTNDLKNKEKQDTNDLINDLCDELEVVQSLPHPFLRLLPWIIVSLAYIGGVVHFLGVRMDLAGQFSTLPFMFEMALSTMIALSACYSAGLLSVPDMHGQGWVRIVPASFFAVWVLWFLCNIVAEIMTGGIEIIPAHWHHCFSDALLMSFVPIVFMTFLVRRGATTAPGWLGFMSVLSVGALGWVTLRLTCANGQIGHVMFFHFAPFVALGVLVGLLAHRLYRW